MRIPVGPGAMHVERYGFGDRPVLLLHGFGVSGFVWRHVAPQLPLGRVTAFAPDLFGWGESDRSPDADYGIPAQAEYLDRALTALRVASADVAALDLGCAVALALAVQRPARVRSMLLINPPDPASLRAGDVTAFRKLAARHLLESSRGMLGAMALLGPVLAKDVARPEAMPRALVGRYAAPFAGQGGVRHLMQLERAINDSALAGVSWEQIVAPVLVVRGESDSWADPGAAAAIVSCVPHAQVRRLRAAGRLIPEDSPEALSGLMRAWLAGDETRAEPDGP